MAKGRNTVFFCQSCGYESAKWMGQCPGCREWNTMVEEQVVRLSVSFKRAKKPLSRASGAPSIPCTSRPSRSYRAMV